MTDEKQPSSQRSDRLPRYWWRGSHHTRLAMSFKKKRKLAYTYLSFVDLRSIFSWVQRCIVTRNKSLVHGLIFSRRIPIQVYGTRSTGGSPNLISYQPRSDLVARNGSHLSPISFSLPSRLIPSRLRRVGALDREVECTRTHSPLPRIRDSPVLLPL